MLGIFIVYGLSIQFLCIIICGLNWLISCRKIQFNIQYSDYQVLANDLQPVLVNVENGENKFLAAIDTNRATDRGMLNLIKKLMNKLQQSRIWFINQGKQFNNWQALSLQSTSLVWLGEEC